MPKPTSSTSTLAHIISGHIRTRKNQPVPGLTVKAYDKKAGKRLWGLGKAKTDEHGQYTIDYTKKVTEAMESQGADLLIKVYAPGNKLIAESQVLVNAPREARINLSVPDEVYRGPSEFERLQGAIGSLAPVEEFGELDDEDVAYLTAKLKLAEDKVQRFCHACQLEVEARELSKDHALTAVSFYGLIREKEQLNLSQLIGQSKQRLQAILRTSADKNRVPHLTEAQIEQQVNALKELAVAIELKGPKNKEEYSIKGLLDILEDLPENSKEKFIRKTTLEDTNPNGALKVLKTKDKDLTKHQRSIETLFTLSRMTRKNLPLVDALYKDLKNKAITEYHHIRDLAKKDKKSWSAYLKEKKVKPSKQGNGDGLTRTAYAEELASTFKKAFPMVDFVHTLETSKVLSKSRKLSADFSKFFVQNSEFNLQQTAIDHYWDKANLKGISKAKQSGLLQELRSWQRVYKLLPDDEQRSERAITLMTMEPPLDSAMKIASMSKSGFCARWTKARKQNSRASLDELQTEAKEIFKRARMIAFMVSATAWKYAAPLDVVRPMVVPPMVQVPATQTSNGNASPSTRNPSTRNFLPDISTLIGQPFYREVLDCQSVLSPAAYLQELLAIPLQKEGDQPPIEYPTIGARIGVKRRDILLLQATTQNTETELPYIDLVNEILERAAIPQEEGKLWTWDLQTTHVAEELALQPENSIEAAYISPAKYKSSMVIPWDKWFEEARLYLNYLELPLYHLIEAFKPVALTDGHFNYANRRKNQLNAVPAMRAMFGLSEPGYAYIKDNLANERLIDIFGIPDSYLENGEAKKLSLLMHHLGFWQGNKKGDNGAEDFVHLRQILGTQYIQDAIPSGQPPIDILFADDPLEGELTMISKDIIIRLAKFERLRRKLNWTPLELHQGIMVFAKRSSFDYDLNANAFSDKVFLQLSHVERLRKAKKGISVVELLSWWGPMESCAGFIDLSSLYQEEEVKGKSKTLYEKVFLDKSLYSEQGETAGEDSEWKYFELSEHKYELKRADDHSIIQHQSLVSAALNLNETDLVKLINFLPGKHKWIFQPILAGVEDPNYYNFSDSLNLKNLSVLYKVVSMARYLDISISEFILAYRLLNLEIFKVKETKGFWGLPPSVDIETEDTILFVEFVKQIQSSPFSIRDLAYLCQHYTESDQELVLVQQRIHQFMEQLKSGLEGPEVMRLNPHKVILDGMLDPEHVAVQKEHDKKEIEDFSSILKGTFIRKGFGETITPLERAQIKQRVEQIFPNHTLKGDETQEGAFENLIDHFASPNRGKRSNWVYSTVMGSLIRLPLPTTLTRHHQDIVLNMIEQFGLSDDTILEVRAKLDLHGGISRQDEVLFNWLLEKLQHLFGLLPAQLPAPLHLPTMNSYIMASFFGRDSLVDHTFPRFIKFLSGSLKKVIYWDEELANFTGLSEKTIYKLIREVLIGQEEGSHMFDNFFNWLHLESTITDEIINRHLLRLDKISWLIKEWGFTLEEIAYIAENGNDFHDFDWNHVPVTGDEPSLSFEQWKGLMEYVIVRDQLSVKKGDIMTLFKQAKAGEGGVAEEAFQTLASLLNMEYTEVKTLASHLRYLDLEEDQEPKDGTLRSGALRNGETLQPLLELLRLTKRCGCSSTVIQNWVKDDDDQTLDAVFEESYATLLHYKITTVEQIRNTVKAQCSEDQWRQVARQFQDQMRIKKRDHLLVLLSALSGISSKDDLYNYLLIDFQMNPCMNTTRIKQAISSVQLYIHRLLMGLEPVSPGVDLEDLKTDWKWKKHYRVWEAQRKVFLYPENWIVPELRDNKSPFFEEFESELAQGEMNEKNIKKAFKHYLRKVDEVGNLEVAAFKQEAEVICFKLGDYYVRSTRNTNFHVIGRSREKPRTYYYRKRNDDQIWEPWEEINLDIESEVVLLTTFKGIPYIFWPSIKERVQKLGLDNPDDKNNDKNNYLPVFEIYFNWSRYDDGRWQQKKKNDEFVELMYDWKYQELYSNPEKLIQYGIEISEDGSCQEDKLTITVSMPASTSKLTQRYYWNDQKVDELFLSLKKLIGETDWTFVQGTDNRLGAKDIEAMVQPIMESIRLSVNSKLYAGNPEEAYTEAKKLVGFPEEDFTGTDADPVKVPRGLLGEIYFWLTMFDNLETAEGYHGHKQGLRGTDVDNIIKVFEAFSGDLNNGDIELEGFEYSYLYTNHAGLNGNKPWTFGQMEFSGYKLNAKVNNSLGLIQKMDEGSDWGWYPVLNQEENNGLPKVGHYSYSIFQDIFSEKPHFHLYDKTNWDLPYLLNFNNNTVSLGASEEDYRIAYFNESETTIDLFSADQSSTFLTLGGIFKEIDLKTIFYHTNEHCYFLKFNATQLNFSSTSFFHSFITKYNNTLHGEHQGSLTKFDSLLNLEVQNENEPFPYSSAGLSNQDEKRVRFELTRPFGIYNWEIFFHMPFTIAVRLSQNKKFAEAQQWFHYIFNPFGSFSLPDSDPELPSRFWNVLPLHELKGIKSIQEMWDNVEERKSQLAKLAEDPFQPHLIARNRESAYQKAVVMKYLDNLIDWGDHLFERDTIETINEATLLYVLAAKILGPRPRMLPSEQATAAQERSLSNGSAQLTKYSKGLEIVEGQMILSSNFRVSESATYALEQAFPITQWYQEVSSFTRSGGGETIDQAVFEGVPHNDKLLSYWDTVADRLFKIRNCRDIEGISRELPIFEPPIDPALLVRGTALGVDISDLLSDLYAPLPPYRFRIMLQKANEFCADVRSLGGALLSALEKKDAEALSLLRAGHEKQMLKLTREIKKQQINELRENLKSTQVSLELAEGRYEYYSSRKFENANERNQVKKLDYALAFNIAGQLSSVGASISYAVANYHTKTTDGSVTIETGGRSLGDAFRATGEFLNMIGSILSHEANMHSIQASRERRWDDWQFQAQQAQKEIKQVEKQILAAEIRLAIAEKELDNHEKQIENSEEVEAFMRYKFTNQDLYNWMIGQISGIYFQTYKMALELARMTQRCYRYERGDESATFIGAAYWDNLKKGLLAGEKLQFDLRRMEQEYYQKNSRELEMTKHISLKGLNPAELHRLRYEGKCTIQIPELLFDLDYPGQYYRRIKSMSISIPAIVGPYSGVNATLRLTKSETRKKADLAMGTLTLDQGINSERIALSSGQNDSGLFELNYNDERYLPFELRGAVSTWELEFPGQLEQFDRTTISDVILHMRYTARQGDPEFRLAVNERIVEIYKRNKGPENLAIALDIRREYPHLWQQFLAGTTNQLPLGLTKERLPYLLRPFDISISAVQFFCAYDLSEANTEEQEVNRTTITLSSALHPEDTPIRLDKVTGSLAESPFFQSGKTALVLEDLQAIDELTFTVGDELPAGQLKELVMVLFLISS